MAFPKTQEILALTVQPELNNSVSANFLTTDILNEALLFISTLEPHEVSRLAKSETSTIAYSLNDYKTLANTRLAARDGESGTGAPTGNRISHMDNRVAGFRVQHVDNFAKSTAAGAGIFLGAGLWAGLGSSVGSIIGRNAVQFGVTAASAWGAHFVTNKVVAVNQIASHIKLLADTFNTTHNAFGEFRNDLYVKRMQYKPDEDHPVRFEEKVTNSNDIIPGHAAEIQRLLTHFINHKYRRVDIFGEPARFMTVAFEAGDPLVISRPQYDYLINLKLP
ncbi:hypothetical protein [Pantoea sp. App145]|jgi:hypothetical protein|uniref:hypothetical protein n=1 Tax=Pantoea sp. App145 TaxID=3071567 RepID=UPI003A8055A5